MGKASSSKKVARAARAGSGGKGTERRALGFPLAIVAVVVLGLSLVVFSRENRDEAVPPRLGDHWHAAYGIWNCDAWEPVLVDVGVDRTGIHTHADGVIHVHPFSSVSSGTGATLGRFFESTGVDASDSRLTLPDGTVLDEAEGCDGDDAELKIARWPADQPNADAEVITQNLSGLRFRGDREVITIALIRDGEAIPRPESVPVLDLVSEVIEYVDPDAPTTTLPDGEEGTEGTDGEGTDGDEGTDGTDGEGTAPEPDDGAADGD